MRDVKVTFSLTWHGEERISVCLYYFSSSRVEKKTALQLLLTMEWFKCVKHLMSHVCVCVSVECIELFH